MNMQQDGEVQQCVYCKEVITHENTITEEAWKEASITGLCEECFDLSTLAPEIGLNAKKYISSHPLLNNIAENVDGVYLGGGIFRNFVDPEDIIEDIDLFFRDLNKVDEVTTILKNFGYEVTFACPKGELYSFKRDDEKIQLITKTGYSSTKDMVDTFDISACRAGIELGTPDVRMCKTFVTSVLNKRAKVVYLEYPLATLKRVMKYRDKGYLFSSKALEELIYNINSMELDEDNMIYYLD